MQRGNSKRSLVRQPGWIGELKGQWETRTQSTRWRGIKEDSQCWSLDTQVDGHTGWGEGAWRSHLLYCLTTLHESPPAQSWKSFLNTGLLERHRCLRMLAERLSRGTQLISIFFCFSRNLPLSRVWHGDPLGLIVWVLSSTIKGEIMTSTSQYITHLQIIY